MPQTIWVTALGLAPADRTDRLRMSYKKSSLSWRNLTLLGLGLQVSAAHQATELDRGKLLVLRELISRGQKAWEGVRHPRETSDCVHPPLRKNIISFYKNWKQMFSNSRLDKVWCVHSKEKELSPPAAT